jgi:hypothetical protein
VPQELQQSDRTEYVYALNYDATHWDAWPILRKTERYLLVGSYEDRVRLDRKALERDGQVGGGRRGLRHIFYTQPGKGNGPVRISPVWLTDREAAEEEARIQALRLLGEEICKGL